MSYTIGTPPIIVEHQDGSTTPYYTSTVNTERGTVLLAARASAVSGDVIRVGAGTYDCGTSQFIVPAGVSIVGAGADATKITMVYDGGSVPCAFKFGDGASANGVHFDWTDGGGHLAYGLGPLNGASFSLINCKLTGTTDGLYIPSGTTAGTITAIGCDISSYYDCVNGADNTAIGTIVLRDCTLTTTFANPPNQAYSRALVCSSGLTIRAYSCTLNSTGKTYVRCVDGTSAVLGNVELYGCKFNSVCTNGTNYDIYGAENVRAYGCVGSGANGTILTQTSSGVAPFMSSYGLNVMDPSSLTSESLTNGVLTSGTSWTATGEMACASDKATFTFSSTGAGTLKQANANLAIKGVAKAWYRFQYVVSAVTQVGAVATITSAFASAAVTLDVANTGTHAVVFQAAAGAASADFVIDVTGVTSGAFTLDSLSLKRITGGNITTCGTISAGSGVLVPLADNDSGAALLGVTVGGCYAITGTGVVMRRAT